MEDLYQKLGVDAAKGSVRKVFSQRVDNDYPGAFVNIVNDPHNPEKLLPSITTATAVNSFSVCSFFRKPETLRWFAGPLMMPWK